ncbi:MAG: hypothetical protein ACKPKO_65845 [Candidatus Fonsibacter sp.]
MDVIQLRHKALNDEDIGTILGTDAKIIRYSELRHIRRPGQASHKGSRLPYCPIRRQTEQGALDRPVKIQRYIGALRFLRQ